MAEPTIEFKIIKHIGILSTSKSDWTKEINLVSWNGREPKWDLRDWSPDHSKCGKGITLSADEVDNLKKLLSQE